MSKAWPLVKLGEVMSQRKQFITIDDTQEYMRCRVQLHAKGIVLRDRVTGSEIKTKQQQVCRADEFLVAEIDAKVGGFGIVPDELENSIVSSHYFLFTIDSAKLNKKFLDYFSKTPTFREQVNAKGSTNYAAIRPHEVLNYTIPLPPLAEQQRIVAKIERLAGKIEEAHKACVESEEETNALLSSKLNSFFETVSKSSISKKTIGSFTVYDRYGPRFYNQPYSDFGTLIIRATDIDKHGNINFHTMPRLDVSKEEIAKLKLLPGDLVIVRSGSIGLSAVFNDLNRECIPSAYLLQFRFDSSIDPYYIRYCLQTPQLKKRLTGRGTSVQNLNANKIKNTQIALPKLIEQQRIVAELDSLQTKIDHLKSIQAQTAAELDALLPSILDKAFKSEL